MNTGTPTKLLLLAGLCAPIWGFWDFLQTRWVCREASQATTL